MRAVLFDWGGTITPWHTVDLLAQWATFAAAVHDEPDLSADLARRLLAAEDAAWRAGRSAGASARLADILRDCGLADDHPGTQAGTAAYRAFWEPHTLTDPAIQPLWEGLRANGIRVGVVSNTIWEREYHRGIFERDGVLHLIDADVYSSEVPWVKPQAEIFAHAAEVIGAEPAECVYVGDRSYEDVHGPQQVGMRAIWIPHSTIPLDQQVSHEATPDAVAEQLADIATIVEQWHTAG